jgi:hypothetical protein
VQAALRLASAAIGDHRRRLSDRLTKPAALTVELGLYRPLSMLGEQESDTYEHKQSGATVQAVL